MVFLVFNEILQIKCKIIKKNYLTKSLKEKSCMFYVKVKFLNIKKTSKGWRRLFILKLTFNTQKHGNQTGLDTLVVHAVTDECLKFISS